MKIKTALFLILLVLSYSVFAQSSFRPLSDKNPGNLRVCKENHLQILSLYKDQIDSEISRLAEGFQYESKNKIKVQLIHQLLVELLIKRIFVSVLQNQLRPVDLESFLKQVPRKYVFSNDLKIDLEKEIGVHLKQALATESLGHHLIKEFKDGLIEEMVKSTGVKVYKAIGAGLLAKIITNGISTSALKSAVLSIGSKAFVSAGTSVIISALTLPLHGYRLPPERIWTDILARNPEMILNPEWMKYGGSKDDPWFTHAYAISRRTRDVEKALKNLLDKEENEFQSRAIMINRFQEFQETKKETNNYMTAVRDETYVRQNPVVRELPPFWAQKKK